MTPSLRTRILTATIAAALLVPTTQAQTTAVTDPVGFITLAIAGAGASADALSFKGLSLTRTVEYQGSAETVGTNSLVDNEATWLDDQFNGAAGDYFLEITSGTGAGTTYDVADTVDGTNTIQLAQNLAAGVTNGVTFKVRKHWTIASVFGATNQAGLQAGDSTTADQILVYSGTGYETYFYQQSFLGTGWRNAGDGSDATNQRLYPEDGLIVKRRGASALSVVLMGAVKTGQSSVPVATGINIMGNVYAAPITLGSSGLFTGNPATGVAGGDQTTADQVLVYNGSGYDTYFYQESFLGNGWKNAADGSDATTVQIPVGASVIVNRRAATAFDWKIPQHPASI